jgi:hypothetical protein
VHGFGCFSPLLVTCTAIVMSKIVELDSGEKQRNIGKGSKEKGALLTLTLVYVII